MDVNEIKSLEFVVCGFTVSGESHVALILEDVTIANSGGLKIGIIPRMMIYKPALERDENGQS